MTIEEEQARALEEAMARADRSDTDLLRLISDMTRGSRCPMCQAIHARITKGLERPGEASAANGA